MRQRNCSANAQAVVSADGTQLILATDLVTTTADAPSFAARIAQTPVPAPTSRKRVSGVTYFSRIRYNSLFLAESVSICGLVKSRHFGINWDPVNELPLKAVPYPDGFRKLPMDRLLNVQMKARALVVGPDFLDWKGIFGALDAAGYRGQVGLETHVFDGTLIEKAHMCMAKIREMVA